MLMKFLNYIGTRLLATFLSLWLAGIYCVIVHGVFLFIPNLSTSSVAPYIIVIDGVTSVLVGFLAFYAQDKELREKEINNINTQKKDVQ